MIKLKDFIQNLNEFVKNNPDALEMYVVASSDDEGNSFSPVHYSPTSGYYDRGDKNFVPKSQFGEFGYNEGSTNSVCIN